MNHTQTELESLQNFADDFNLEIKEYFQDDKRKTLKKYVAVRRGSTESVSNVFDYDQMNVFLIGIDRGIKYQLTKTKTL